LGAVFSVLFLGFFIIPNFGISTPIYLLTSFLGMVVIAMSKKEGEKKFVFATATLGIVLVVLGVISTFTFTKTKTVFKMHKILYETEGLLGQVTVIDHFHGEPNRMLYVNGISQTNEDLKTGISNGLYVHRISVTSSFKPEGSDVLILGMGGGSLVKEFLDLKFNVDICELDERMSIVSKDFFGLDTSKATITIDDARHFINTSSKKYDIIVFDIALGEIQPSHLFTTEAFQELKRLLKDDQSFVFFHYTDRSKKLLASRSICKTLESAGYAVKEFIPKPGLEDDKVFVALITPPDMKKFIPGRQNKCCEKFGSRELLVGLKPVNTSEAFILTDDLPQLDILNKETSIYYRNQTIKELLLKRMTGVNF
ncbi:MAG: fused MFS/spermidine synthase, partial [Bacteroidetes bacterium]|nr:fused MFS/spermidine synthase [Bacteroidota bacterium]